jgi:AraC-like DNA-binding protein
MAMEKEEERTPEWLAGVRRFLDERFTERLSLAEAAMVAGVHPVYLGRAFRCHYGCSIGEYLTRRRMELARRLIAQGDLSLTQIAVASGFYDQGHFSNKFKKYHGMSPSDFRNAARNA